MVVCFDTTGIIYTVLDGMTSNVTGSFFLSTLVIAILFLAIASAFRIPIEISMIILLPLHLSLLACLGNDWMGLTGTVLIYLGILLGKNLFFRS